MTIAADLDVDLFKSRTSLKLMSTGTDDWGQFVSWVYIFFHKFPFADLGIEFGYLGERSQTNRS